MATEGQTPRMPRRHWTVMNYMAAGDSPELDAIAIADLREMERGCNEHAHVVVQINRAWPDSPQRYHMIERSARRSDGGETPRSEHVGESATRDMGDRETLREFLEWAVAQYPANHYMLVLWGHAYGLGFGRDHGDPLTLPELVYALADFKARRSEINSGEDGTLDVLGANSCAMSYVEAAFELRQSATYLVASQITIPFAGWPYDAILSSIDDKTDPAALGSAIVQNYTDTLNTPLMAQRVQMAMLDLRKAEQLQAPIQTLARCLRETFSGQGPFDSLRKQVIRDTFLRTATGDVRPLIDLVNFCTLLQNDVCETEPASDYERQNIAEANSYPLIALKNACAAVLGELTAASKELTAAPKELTAASKDEKGKLVVKCIAHPSLIGLNGVGIFAPFVTDEHDLKRLELEDVSEVKRSCKRGDDQNPTTNRQSYEALALFQAGADWPSLVYDALNEPVPAEFMDFVAGIGVQRSSDRTDIIQIILAIESSFNRLDRLLERARECVLAEVYTFIGRRADLAEGKTEEGKPAKAKGSDSGDASGAALAFKLRLLPPLDMKSVVATFKLRREFEELTGIPAPPSEKEKMAASHDLLKVTVGWLAKLEDIVEQIETATHKGLTHARFGLSPVEVSPGFNAEPPKSGYGPPQPGPDQGNADGVDAKNPPSRTFVRQTEIGMRQVRELFETVAQALRDLEQSIAELELQVREVLTGSRQLQQVEWNGLRDYSRDVSQAFAALCESAVNSRRSIRRAIAHPVYGLRPSSSPFALEAREELAFSAGFSQSRLRLLIPRFQARPVNR